MERFHPYTFYISDEELPRQFTWPFCYEPHPLCVKAAKAVRQHLNSVPRLAAEAAKGKMFGVLVVRRKSDDAVGFIAAYSGFLDRRNDLPWFVPPVFDLLAQDGFFKQGEAEISAINDEISRLESADEYARLKTALKTATEDAASARAEAKTRMAAAKARRDELRRTTLTPESEEALLNESRHQKAEYRRLKQRLQAQIDIVQSRIDDYERHIKQLCADRKTRSAALQHRLFDNYVVTNARGERQDLNKVFQAAGIAVPPSGAGECAAPKLLQYAYDNGLHPLAMAEFWIGQSPRGEVRRDGYYYPSCRGKCAPILTFMMQGLDVEHDPVAQEAAREHKPTIIYDDRYMTVIDKPAGMLSVPGKLAAMSAVEWVERELHLPHPPYAAHRLDMDTSGLLVIAKDVATLRALQSQFRSGTVIKHYYAMLDGTVHEHSGRITLRLSPDYHDRPRQKVDQQGGREAVTDFTVISHIFGMTYVMFRPLTGRTHQLRVHSASPLGLGVPIAGDRLYGRGRSRLYLHAINLQLDHPATGKRMIFFAPPPF